MHRLSFKKLKIPAVLILIAFLSLQLTGCITQDASMGTEGSIVIAADEFDQPIIRPAVERTFGKTIYTPQPESYFSIDWMDADKLSNKTASPLILLASSLEGDGPTTRLIRKMLAPDALKGVELGDYVVFRRRDPWAAPQLLLILAGENRFELGKNAEEWADSLFNWAHEFEIKRLQKKIFRRGEQKDLSAELIEKYGFNIRIQHDYITAQENDSLQFVRLIRHIPERWIMVHWGVREAGEKLNADFIFKRRKKLGAAFLDPVETYNERWTGRKRIFKGNEAVEVNGIWATVGPTGGGPFYSIGILDSANDKYYLIDGAVFAPGEKKSPYIWQLRAILETFKL